MIVNYRSLPENLIREETHEDLLDHYAWLAKFTGEGPGSIPDQPAPEGYENYHVVDVLGDEFIWMNKSFPIEQFTWYVWYESVFLVPNEMLMVLKLRWL